MKEAFAEGFKNNIEKQSALCNLPSMYLQNRTEREVTMKYGLSILILCSIAVLPGAADVIHVPSEEPTIQAGIDAAVDGDTVLVAAGMYTGTGNRDIDFSGKAITVKSEGGSTGTIIDCEGSEDNPCRGLIFQNGEGADSRLEGFTITNGFLLAADQSGAGILCLSSSPAIEDCIITENVASTGNNWGGGIACYVDASPMLTDCIISHNSAEGNGGGMFCFDSSPSFWNCSISDNSSSDDGGGVYAFRSNLTLSGCTCEGNEASFGAGIYCNESTFSLADSHILRNKASRLGGGIYGDRSTITIAGGAIIENTAEEGGGLYCVSSTQVIDRSYITGNTSEKKGGGIYSTGNDMILTNSAVLFNSGSYGGGFYCTNFHPEIANCLFADNRSSNYGGGIYLQSSVPAITNCTFSNNSSDTGGGGIYSKYFRPSVTNCIIWNNSPDEIYTEDSHPEISYSNVKGGWTGNGNIDVQPLFRNPENGDYHLQSKTDPDCGDPGDSPCIDAGDPAITDLTICCELGLGSERSDMGAYGGQAETHTAIAESSEGEEFRQKESAPHTLVPHVSIRNCPNPFNPSTTIRYILPSRCSVSLKIYDTTGKLVRTLLERTQHAGQHSICWRGFNDSAQSVSSGIYICRLKAGEATETIKMMLIK
jgi:predicted outer membrane repeat protein